MKTKQFIGTVLLMLLWTATAVAQVSNRFYVPDISSAKGSTILLPFYADNSTEVVAVQFDIKVPEGCMPDLSTAKLTDRRNDHTLSVRNTGRNTYTCIVYSPTNQPLRANAGKLLTINMAIPDSFEEGKEYAFALNNVVLSAKDGTNAVTGVDAGKLRIIKMPDLTVKNIQADKGAYSPGTEMSVSWQVENIGEMPTTGGWKEQISLVDNSGNSVLVGSAYNEPLLTAGTVVSRQITLTLPALTGIDGNVQVQIRLIPNADAGELPEAQANNTATTEKAIMIDKKLYLELPTSAIDETYASPIQCKLSRSGSWAHEEIFAITSTTDSRVEIPSYITVPAGQSGVVFYVYVRNNEMLDKDSIVSLSVSGNGYSKEEGTLTIEDDEFPTLTIEASTDGVKEGESLQLTITTERTSAQPIEITLSCEYPKRFEYPAKAIIPAGQTGVTVEVKATDDDVPDTDIALAFTATAPRHNKGEVNIVLEDNDIPALEMELTPNKISESAGVTSIIGTLRRLDNTDKKITVKLSDDSNGQLYYPNPVLIMEAGIQEIQFAMGAIDNAIVDGERELTVTAAVYLSSCSCSASGTSAGIVAVPLTILDDDGPTLKLTSSISTVKEGGETRLTIARNTSSEHPLTVTLSSNYDEGLAYEHNVTIPAGQSSAEMTVTAKKNDTADDSHTVVFTVDAADFSKGTCWIMVTDQTLPDARLTAFAINPAEVEAGGTATAVVTVMNDGNAVLKAPAAINIYIEGSSNAIATLYTQTDLAVGESTELSKEISLPDATGNLSLYATINEKQSIKELLYVNNTSEKASVTMLPLFTATVSTDKTVYLQGESITINGNASGSGATNATVEVYIINDGARQTIETTTDDNGKFTAVWTPYALQSGRFTLGACYPGEGLKEAQHTLDICGLQRTSNGYITCRTQTDEAYNSNIKLHNPCGIPLTGVNIELLSVPENCTATFAPMSEIKAGETVSLSYTLMGKAPSTGNDWEQLKARVTTNEGASLDLTLYYYCYSAKAQLEGSIQSINTTMIKGASRDYPFTIANKGKGETGKITIALPSTGWMSTATPKEMPSLAYGESATVILRLTPTDEMALNIPITGSIGINCENGNGIPLNFNITPVSESTGTLVVDVCDEYTYNTSEAPHVSGAQVLVKNPTTGAIVAKGTTGDDGLFRTELTEGYYAISVTADKHDSYSNNILIDPGKENTEDVFLSFNAITYSWDVVETEIEDVYEVKTTVKYETRVPAPVVVVDFPEIPYESSIVNVIVTNKGLLSAYNIKLNVPSNSENMKFTVLGECPIAELHAQESIAIPVQVSVNEALSYDNVTGITFGGIIYDSSIEGTSSEEDENRTYEAKTRKSPKAGANCESITLELSHDKKECNKTTGKWETVGTESSYRTYYYGDCFGNGGGGSFSLPYIPNIFNIHTPSPGSPNPPTENGDKKRVAEEKQEEVHRQIFDGCTTNCEDARAKAAAGCATATIGCIPILGTAASLFNCGASIGVSCFPQPQTVYESIDCWLAGLSCIPGPAGCIAGIAGCLKSLIDEYNICNNQHAHSRQRTNPKDSREQGILLIHDNLSTTYDNLLNIFKDGSWLEITSEERMNLSDYIIKYANDKGYIELSSDRYNYKPERISNEQFDLFIERINNTTDLKNGIINNSDNVIDIDTWEQNMALLQSYNKQAIDLGYTGGISELGDSINSYYEYLLKRAQEIKSSSVCASITLQFSQTMTMTRQAFRGTLTVFNGNGEKAMENVRLNLDVRDEEGNSATSHEFQINAESLDGFAGEVSLDNGWTLAANETGVATVVFIPTKYAAPTEAKEYSFGGTLSYLDPFTGLEVTRDLYPVTLTVKPSPNLDLTYFMQRDIYGDDALTTDIVEPKVAAEFSLLINNVGNGDATNVRMVTEQPKIIENEKGLLIDFELLSSQLNGEEKTLALGGSVPTDFGTIPAHTTAYAQWWFESSLLGHFTEYDVKATHVTSYDNPDLTLLNDVTIHELIRSLKVPAADGQSLAGFLVNDVEDAEDTPDMLYLSDGTTENVHSAASASCERKSDTEYTLTISPSASGWNYGSVADPTMGRQQLASIVREDGTPVDIRNFWQTDRTLRDGRDPLYENRLHFADKTGTATVTYTLTFTPKPDYELEVEAIEDIPSEIACSPVTTVKVRFNKPIVAASFSAEDLQMAVQGVQQDISTIQMSTEDNRTFVLDVSPLTTANGYYTITVNTAGITDAEGFCGRNGKSAGWTQYIGNRLNVTAKAVPTEGGQTTPSTGIYEHGSTVTFTAAANEGYEFLSWSINGKTASLLPDFDYQVNGEEVLTANFAVRRYRVNIEYDEAQGNVTGGGTGIYNHGDALLLTAQPAEGYHFNGWSDGTEDNKYTLRVVSDISLMANFAPNFYKAIFVLDEQHTEKEFAYGAKVEAPEAPEKTGYTFKGWNNLPETMPANAIIVTGLYTANRYAVVYYVGDEIYATDYIAYGNPVVLREYEPTGERYTFIGWEGEVYETMPAHDIVYHASIADAIENLYRDSVVDVYSVYGIKVKSDVPVEHLQKELPKGIYIIDGKKMIIR